MKKPLNSVFSSLRQSKFFSLVDVFGKVQEETTLPYYHGLHSIKKQKQESDSFFALTPEKIVEGYLDASGSKGIKTLDLTGPKDKIVISLQQSVYHFLIDDLGGIMEAFKQFPDAEYIIDVSGVHHEMFLTDSYHFYKFFAQSLNDYGIDYKIVHLMDFDVIYMDKFYILDYGYIPVDRGHSIFNYFLPYVEDKSIEPTKKVFLSRTKMESDYSDQVVDKSGKTLLPKKRMDDETKLERLFVSLGYEIVYPENFKDFREQINFFYSVKTIASLTSSGLSNSVFMQPGGNVIEITTPLIVAPIASDGAVGSVNIEVHHFYKHLAYQKGHFYFSLPNPDLKIQELLSFIKGNKWLRKMLKEV
jgi:hypothetical protein